MNETEKYLNSILSKRLGSVVNEGATTKNPNTVTRIPLSEESVDKMPTVFRKKYETVLIQQESMVRDTRVREMMESRQSAVIEAEPVENHRVEYMAISKRITVKNTEELICPTVDVNKYESKVRKRLTLSPDVQQTMEAIPDPHLRKSESQLS